MPISDYLKQLRSQVGSQLLLVPSVTGIIYDERGRVLLVNHADRGLWVAPGGSIEPNESPADATVREVWEETGLVTEPIRIIGLFGGPNFEMVYRNGDRVTYVQTVFECRILGGAPRPDGVETLQLAYFSETEIVDLSIPAWMEVVMPVVFGERNQAYFQQAIWRPPT
jgi:8-oxo-dGTP pyrophosphatase MutT (NUDIX family)